MRNLRPGTKGKNLTRLMSVQAWGTRSAYIILLCVSFSLFIYTSLNPAGLRGARMQVADLTAPLISAVHDPIQQGADYIRMVTGLAQLQSENERLRKENMRLREWHQTALHLTMQNNRLKELLHLQLPPSYSYITGRIVADSGNAYAKSVLVIAGHKDGVEKGHAVMAADGLVGRVVETGKAASRILLMTDINSRIPVIIEDNNVRAILAGQNDNTPLLIHTPPDEMLQDGMRVLTSGHGGLFPPGLPVGKIHLDEQGKPHVLPFTDIEKIRYVRIVDSDIDPNLIEGHLEK